MSKFTLICLFLLTVSIHFSSSSEPITEHGRIERRIVAGWFIESYKDAVFGISFDDARLNLSRICTGTFIAPNAMLTVAHCCADVQSSIVRIHLSNYPPNQTLLIYEANVLAYHIQPDYSESKSLISNIAIIEFTEDIDWIIPASIMDRDDKGILSLKLIYIKTVPILILCIAILYFVALF